MCIGIPMKVVRLHGAEASDGGLAADCVDAHGPADRVERIDLSLVGPVAPGEWVLTFLGAARERLSAERADQIARALAGARAVLTGDALGDAFADLEDRGPQLPPHLEAARRAGRATG